jgi:hypothetical protein
MSAYIASIVTYHPKTRARAGFGRICGQLDALFRHVQKFDDIGDNHAHSRIYRRNHHNRARIVPNRAIGAGGYKSDKSSLSLIDGRFGYFGLRLPKWGMVPQIA